jgi:hypothetical protein
MNSTEKDEIADPVLYRLYWGFMLGDILFKIKNEYPHLKKEDLHEFHKKELGYPTIAGQSQETVSMFLFQVCVWWAVEKGLFVRTKEEQPIDIEWRPLHEVWHLL